MNFKSYISKNQEVLNESTLNEDVQSLIKKLRDGKLSSDDTEKALATMLADAYIKMANNVKKRPAILKQDNYYISNSFSRAERLMGSALSAVGHVLVVDVKGMEASDDLYNTFVERAEDAIKAFEQELKKIK